MEDNGKIIGGAFLLGGVAGAVIALLYAPKSGRETRRDVSRTARRISDEAVDLIEETIEDVNGFARDLKEKASDIVEQGTDLSGRTWKEVVATLEHGQRAIEKRRKRLKKALGI
ncbi:MAG: YtxH domain-containing protein [Candidatus Sulfobium sp.]|jgi:gas vesicle protein